MFWQFQDTVLEPLRSIQKPLAAVASRIRHKLKTESRAKELERLLASVKV